VRSLKKSLKEITGYSFLLVGAVLLILVNFLLSQTLEHEINKKIDLSLIYQNKILETIKEEETGFLRVLSNETELNYLLKYNVKRVRKGERFILENENEKKLYSEYRKITKKIDKIIMLNVWRKSIHSQARARETGLEIFDNKGIKIASIAGNNKMKKTSSQDIRIRKVLNLDTKFKIKTIITDIEEANGLLYFKTFVPIPEASSIVNGVAVLSYPIDNHTLLRMRNRAESELIVLDKNMNVLEKTFEEKIDLKKYKEKIEKEKIINIKNKKKEYLLKFIPITNFNNGVIAYLGVVKDKSTIMHLKTKLNFLITFLIVFIILAALIIEDLYIKKNILKPLKEIIKTFRKNSENNYEKAKEKKLPKELYEIQNAYNEMVDKIYKNIIELERKDEKLNETNKELLAVIKAKDKMYKKAIKDGLTKLYNHAFFQKSLLQEIKRVSRYKIELSLLLLDIDNFKSVNDKYGHQKGDEILKKVSEIPKKMVRKNDMVARYGGEEIAIILPHTNLENAYQLAERIRMKIKEETIVTVSIGVATYFSGNDESVNKNAEEIRSEIIEQADLAMYFSKENGKNKVTKYKKTMGF